MTKKELIHYCTRQYPQSISYDWDACCPCSWWEGEVDGYKLGIATRCWRVSETNEFQDLHIWGDLPYIKEIAEMLKYALDKQEWYNQYRIIFKEPFK